MLVSVTPTLPTAVAGPDRCEQLSIRKGAAVLCRFGSRIPGLEQRTEFLPDIPTLIFQRTIHMVKVIAEAYHVLLLTQ